MPPKQESERAKRCVCGGLSILIVLAVGMAILKTSYSWYEGEMIDTSMIVHWGIAGLLCIVLQAAPMSYQKRVLGFFAGFLFLEALLQAMALLGVLPHLEVRSHTPYGRVYWTREGFGNGMMNRWGHYYRHVGPKKSRRILLLGDSFVEALQIPSNAHMGIELERRINDRGGEQVEVIAVGRSGRGPAHYLEMFEYAYAHFQPDEVIVCFFAGNDTANCHPSLEDRKPKDYTFFRLDETGKLALDPRSERAPAKFRESLERNHRSVLETGYHTFRSHFMTRNVLQVLRDRAKEAMEPATGAAEGGGLDLSEGRLAVFEKDPPAPWPEADAIALKLLGRLQNRTRELDVTLRVAMIPFFPEAFYRRYAGQSAWSPDLGTHDLSRPERLIQAFCEERRISFAATMEHLTEADLSVDTIRSYYYWNGSGHYSVEGHAMMAKVMFDTFYASQGAAE